MTWPSGCHIKNIVTIIALFYGFLPLAVCLLKPTVSFSESSSGQQPALSAGAWVSARWNTSICGFSGESLLFLSLSLIFLLTFLSLPLSSLWHISPKMLCSAFELKNGLDYECVLRQTRPPKEKTCRGLGSIVSDTLSYVETLKICYSSCPLIRPQSQGFQEESHLSAVNQKAACPSQALPLPQEGD